jgi:hypothetical protein
MNSCEHSNEFSGCIKVGNVLINQVIISYPRKTLHHGVYFVKCTSYQKMFQIKVLVLNDVHTSYPVSSPTTLDITVYMWAINTTFLDTIILTPQ